MPHVMESRRTASPSVTDEVLTVQEVADYLKVTTKTVYEIIKQGSLPSFRIGRAVRCRRSAVEDFIECQLTTADAPVGKPAISTRGQD